MTARQRFFCLSAGLWLAGGGCAWWSPRPALPVQHSVVLGQLVVYTDFALPEHHRLLEELTSQRAALGTKLGLAVSDEPIHVYLFSNADEFKAFIRSHYPDFPDRRAFFVESDTRLMVYAHWGDRVAEDLRHEVAHGYLHSVVAHLPLWLDEGLAEYFEVPRGTRGLNRPHVRQLAALAGSGWRPNLPRLEQLRSASDMTEADYAEAWAWVHFLLETTPERRHLIRGFLQSLCNADNVEPLSSQLGRLQPDCEQKLVEYIAGLDQSLR